MNKLILGTVFALVVIGAIGLLLYWQAASNNVPRSAQTNRAPWVASLSPDDKKFFNTPMANATDEEKASFSNMIYKSAQKSDMLHIGKVCQPQPIVFAVDTSTNELTVKNDDVYSHVVRIAKDQRYILAPGSSAEIKIGQDKRALGYGCDQFNLVGFLVR